VIPAEEIAAEYLSGRITVEIERRERLDHADDCVKMG
jgi:hypothetical protein